MKRLMNSITGFTLIELMIAVAVMSALSMAVVELKGYIDKSLKYSGQKFEETASGLLATRRLWMDLRHVTPSFNYLIRTDDLGREFFEFESEQRCAQNCTRTIELTVAPAPAQKKSIDFLLADSSAGPTLYYPPAKAYTSAAHATPGNEGTLSFVSLNRNSYLTGMSANPWKVGQAILLVSPIPQRAESAGVPNTAVPSRPLAFTGRVVRTSPSSGDFTAVDFSNVLRTTHPVNGSAVSNADTFFRTLPAAGGKAAFAFLKPVALVRYELEPMTLQGKVTGRLSRLEWVPGATAAAGGFSKKNTLAEGVKSVLFSRRDISLGSVEFKINFDFKSF